MLSPAEFGDVQVFVSLLSQIGIFLGAFSIIAVNISSNTENTGERNAIMSELQKVCFWIVCVVSGALIIGTPFLSSFLNLSSFYPVAAVVISLFLSINGTFRAAFLQGQSKFFELSVNGLISAIGRIVFVVILIWLGMRSMGAVWAMVLTQGATLYYVFLKTRTDLNLSSKTNIHVLEKGSIKKELLYGLLIIFATGLVTFMYTTDILIMKHLFNAHDAGLYSGISTISKGVFFLVSPVAVVLLSSVKIRNTKKENLFLLLKSLGIAIFLGTCSLLVFWLFNDITIKILLGKGYLPLDYLLPKVGLVMLLISIVNVLVCYYLALRNFLLIALSCIGVLCTAILLFLNHGSIDAVLNSMILSLSILIILFISYYVKNYFSYNPGPQ